MVCKVCEATESIKWYKQGTECRSCFNKAYLKTHRQRVMKLRKNWLSAHPDKNKQYKKHFEINHRETFLAIRRNKEARHRAAKLNAVPKWLNEEQLQAIKSIYIDCPKGFHVDHIVPLKGKNVCGLHVPWNLKAIPAEDNVKKSNKFNLDSDIIVLGSTCVDLKK